MAARTCLNVTLYLHYLSSYIREEAILILKNTDSQTKNVKLSLYRPKEAIIMVPRHSGSQDLLIYLLTAIGLSPGGSSTVHIYTQTIHRTTQNKQYIEQHNNLGKCGPCPVLASYTLAFALQLRKKHGKTSVRVAASKNIYTTYRQR